MFISELFDRKLAHRDGVDLEVRSNKTDVSIYAYDAGGRELAHVHFDKQPYVSDQERKPILVPYDLEVGEDYRGQGIAAIMYNYAKELGYEVQRSYEQTAAGEHFWKKNRGNKRVWEDQIDEISPERLERYLARADKHVSNRMDRMSQARQRLSKSYEIYHADRPAGSAQIVDRFEADTPALARQYYEKFIQNYDSDVDFDLRLRKGTGIIQEARLPGAVEDFLYNLTPEDVGVDEIGPYRIHYEGFTDDCQSAGDYCENPEAVYQQVFADHIAREGGRKPIDQNFTGDEDYPILYSVFKIPKQKSVNEITLVPSVAKSKREHLDVMPNDGKPIPQGQESEYLGDLVSEMGRGFQLWSWTDRGTVTYYVFDTSTRTCQLGTTGRPYKTNRDSFVVQGVYSGPRNRYRAADLYAFLIINRGLTLVSDNKQSAGGYRVWQELEQRYGRKINIHGFDTKTNEPVNVTTQDEPDTHVDRATVKSAGPQMKKELGTVSRDLRFVASAR